VIRLTTIDTAHQGLGIDVVSSGQGKLTGRTETPYGVELVLDGAWVRSDGSASFQITADALAELGRFFLAAAVHCGQDIS